MSNLALAEPAAPASTVDEQLDRRLRSGGGAPVARDVAARASSAYGTDLGGVRVHTDSHAAAMAEAHGFQAFAYGGDVFGTASALDTGTPHGQHVMMHELAHVAQTGGERAGGVHGKVEVGTATDASDALEVDADQGAAAAIAGRTLEPLLRTFGDAPTSEQILSLKVCDPAMGSGAFLVEACRFLGERLLEAWAREGKPAASVGNQHDAVTHARRLVAERVPVEGLPR